jgi:hypothetical protein
MKSEKHGPLTLRLELELSPEEYGTLSEIYNSKGKKELTEKVEGGLNNWILEMLLDQEPMDY